MDDTNNQGVPATPEETPTEEAETQTTPDAGDAQVLLNLDQLIKNNIGSLGKLQEELKKHKEMFTDAFINDPTFKEHEEKAKEANKIKQQTRQQILKQPSMHQLADKIKTLATEMREKKQSLSEYLLEYQRLTGANEIQTDDGELLSIINSAKLVRQAPKK